MATQAPADSIVAIDSLIRDFSPSNIDEVASNSPKNKAYNYSIGDVVRINVMRKINTVTRLARIRAIDVKDDTLNLFMNNNNDNDNNNMNNNDDEEDIKYNESSSSDIKYYGVEFFNYRKGNNTDLIEDGVINGNKIFDVKKPGYGGFVTNKQIKGAAVWTKKKSKSALKLKSFNNQTFIKAAKYGSMPVIKHMLQMNDYPNDPSLLSSSDKITKGINYSAICFAIYNNHYEIVNLLFDKHLTEQKENNDDDEDDNKNNDSSPPSLRVFKPRRNSDVLQSKDGKTKFYNASVFDKLCRDSNIRMLSLLFSRDSWPVYYKNSYGLYSAVTCGDIEMVKLLLSNMNDPRYINYALFFDTKQRTIIPQTNLNLLNVAIGHHRLEIMKYLICEWKFRDVIIKDRCIYDEKRPHQLPTLLYTVLDCHLHHKKYINFTCDAIELLLTKCDPLDVGLNWVCDKRLSEQKNIVIGDISNLKQHNQRILYINRTLCIGTLLSGLIYKCLKLWESFRAFDEEKNELKLGIERLIKTLVCSGIDWNMSKYDKNVKNVIMKYTTYPHYDITDLDEDICPDPEFVKFFRDTVSNSIAQFRKVWLDSFLNFYKEDKLMANIFKWYVLDFVVPRQDILDSIKYFTLKNDKDEKEKKEKEEKKKKKKKQKDDPNYINWDDDEDEESEFDDPLATSFGVLRY